MAKKTQAETEKFYFIVNPTGAIHNVTREHAVERLRLGGGWRVATAEEVQALKEADGHQTFDAPICKPWSPEPDAIELPE